MWQTVMTMMDAGWSCLAWSDGSTANLTGTVPGPYANGPGDPDPVYPQTGTFPNSGSASAGGFGNTRAWIILRQPKPTGSQGFYAGTRMFMLQRGTTDVLWRMKYSKAGVWAGNGTNSGGRSGPIGLATNQNTPSAIPSVTASLIQGNDEINLMGAGTDSAPTYNTWFNGTNGGMRHNTMANDGLSGELAPYGFYAVGWTAGGGQLAAQHVFLFDPCIAASTAAVDQDPFVIQVDGSANGFRTGQDSSYNADNFGTATWYRYNLSNPAGSMVNVAAAAYYYRVAGVGVVQIVPGADAGFPLGTNSHNGNDDFFPVPYMRRGAAGGNTGYKGVSSLVRWNSAAHAMGDTFALLTTRDRIATPHVNLPWDGSVPLI